jgi:hypothetical protein
VLISFAKLFYGKVLSHVRLIRSSGERRDAQRLSEAVHCLWWRATIHLGNDIRGRMCEQTRRARQRPERSAVQTVKEIFQSQEDNQKKRDHTH